MAPRAPVATPSRVWRGPTRTTPSGRPGTGGCRGRVVASRGPTHRVAGDGGGRCGCLARATGGGSGRRVPPRGGRAAAGRRGAATARGRGAGATARTRRAAAQGRRE